MMTHCPVTGVCLKRFALSLLAGFVFVFAFNFLVHGNILMGLYEQTAHLWRSEEEMQKYFGCMLGFNFLTVFAAGLIYTRNHEGKGVMEGVRFGTYLGFLLAVIMANPWVWMPIPVALALGWGAAGFFLGLGLGVIFALTYRK